MLLGAASMSGNKGKSIAYSHHLADSSSRNFCAEEANYRNKEVVHAEQVKILDKRLRILEDEAELIKEAFLEGVEERRKLVNATQNEIQAVNNRKRHRHGLPQLLSEESNPAVVIRELKASDAVFQDATECVCEFSDR
ncbi:uncharacterized protein LOC132055598 [Lycium ferocissimum]|uniref:uncharacterized protein LOC132055598 n=1 Tax=Lycium ferocissimum TaxID=112874 RepID=UPI00281614C3|nr:uncharacterized protein LOC132055598 [Lycium ferocissimum]